jgi:hypothetical protein
MSLVKFSSVGFRAPTSALAAFALTWLLASFASAMPAPVLSSTEPLAIQRGQSQEVTLNGQHLASVQSVTFPDARGLEVTLIPPPTTQPTDGQVRLKLTAASDAALGERELRVVSPGGVSQPLRVAVGQYPTVAEHEPNNTPDQGQDVPLPATLVGKIDGAGDVDCFRFAAARGQTLVFDVHAVRSGSQLDPIVTLHDWTGKELAPKVQLHGGDPTLIFQAPADGRYELEIRDLEYRGGGAFTYRVDAGPIPYVEAILPMTAQPGKVAEVEAIGVNLDGSGKIPLDLTYATPGEIALRARAALGMSNPIKFDVDDLPPFACNGSNRSLEAAALVRYPVDISSRLDKSGAEDFYKFHVARKQPVTLEVIATRLGSAIDPLLTLRNDKGNPIETSNNATDADARISRELDPGDYVVSVRDLMWGGGSNYPYRLQILPGVAGQKQDFNVKFGPDALRLSRNGNVAVYCEVQRIGGFKGDITVTVEGLPPGVTCPPVVFNNSASDVFTISASGDAIQGTYPIHLRASATVENRMLGKTAQAELNGRPVQQAYLTVLDPAPFTLEALAGMTPQRIEQLNAEADAINKKLTGPNPELEAAQAQWEKHVSGAMEWTAPTEAKIASAQGSQFTLQPDGSFLATGNPPDKDIYTVTLKTSAKGITAIRLEVLPDDSLPHHGPGRGDDGNFVLSKLTVAAASEADPEKKTAITLHGPRALFEQDGYGVTNAIEPQPGKGWGIHPHMGQANAAFFFTQSPVGDDKGTILTLALDQQFGNHLNLGRFRFSVTNDPDAQAKAALPEQIVELLKTPGERRNSEQKAQVSAYYRSIDPRVAAETHRLELLQEVVAPYAEAARLEAALKSPPPQADAGRGEWEEQMKAGVAWLPLEFKELKSEGGATLKAETDGSVLVSGNSPVVDTYTLTGSTNFKGITAIRLEPLPDPRLPGNGPGRADNGNFVLTRFLAFASPSAAPSMSPPLEWRTAKASVEQQGYPLSSALDSDDNTGWAIMPNLGMPACATFYTKEPIGPDGGSQLTIVLEHRAGGIPRHTLGHFRVWVTSNPNPDLAPLLPGDILAALRMPVDKRNDEQRKELTRYWREIAPPLEPIRYRLGELKSQIAAATEHPQYRSASIPFLVNRNNFPGEVQVTLEGFSAGRRRPITDSLKFEPMRVGGGALASSLSFRVEPAAETGTRMAVLKAETKIGDETVVEYSPAFPLTTVTVR